MTDCIPPAGSPAAIWGEGGADKSSVYVWGSIADLFPTACPNLRLPLRLRAAADVPILNRASRFSPSADRAGRASASATCCDSLARAWAARKILTLYETLALVSRSMRLIRLIRPWRWVGGGQMRYKYAVHLTGQLGCLYYTYVNIYICTCKWRLCIYNNL